MPGLSANVGGRWKPVKAAYANDAGTWKPVKVGSANNGGAWSPSFAALSASASPATVGGSGSTPGKTFPSFATAAPSGGVGPFTYAWSKVSDDGNGTWGLTNPSTATPTATVSGVASGASATAGFQCLVTDTGTGAAATTNTVNVTYNRL